MSEAKNFRKSFINAVYKPSNTVHILETVNDNLRYFNKCFKDKSINSPIINFEKISYKYWLYVSEVYLFCKKNKYKLKDQLKKFKLSIESDEKYSDNPELVTDLFDRAYYDFLIMDDGEVVITKGMIYNMLYYDIQDHNHIQGNTSYITINVCGVGSDFPKGIDCNLNAIPKLIDKIIQDLNEKYMFSKIGSVYCELQVTSISDMISKTDNGKLCVSWNIQPKVQIDVIYSLEEDKFYIVLLPFVMLYDNANISFVIYSKKEYPQIYLTYMYFEPFELDLDKLRIYDSKPINREIKEFESICEKIKPVLMNAIVSLVDAQEP